MNRSASTATLIADLIMVVLSLFVLFIGIYVALVDGDMDKATLIVLVSILMFMNNNASMIRRELKRLQR